MEDLIKTKYINKEEVEKIKNRYLKQYKITKRKLIKTKKEKEFLKRYKNIDNYINSHNSKVINNLSSKIDILNNINGYALDEYQKRVVLSEEKVSLVIAGAGSGKSLTIIGKIVYLIKIKKVKPSEILCISFTNDATKNLGKNIKKNYNYDIEIYTFHKLALTILKDNNEKYDIAEDNLLEMFVDNFFENKHNSKIDKIINNIKKENRLNKTKRTIITFINIFKSNNYDIQKFKEIIKKLSFKNYKENKEILILIINIYLSYQHEIEENNLLDFNDMINKSIKSLKEKGLKRKWKYIIIDEYQDTSFTKFELIKSIINLTNANLLVVGDDFQSIYRFTGCDLNMFLNFNRYFNHSKIFYIVNTYRNPQELINVAGSFIMKNKKQQKKNLVSNKHIDKPIKIYNETNKVKSLKEVLILLKDSKDIMVLGRNNKDINTYIDKDYIKKDEYYIYKNIRFKYLTIHKSKGLESENIILINIENSITGMPTKLVDEDILKYVNNTKDYFPYEEERRLFYVALTRTKNYVYILNNPDKESVFIKEIKKYKKYVEQIKR